MRNVATVRGPVFLGASTYTDVNDWVSAKDYDALHAEAERLREAGVGYSQATVDALTKERDDLQLEVRDLQMIIAKWSICHRAYGNTADFAAQVDAESRRLIERWIENEVETRLSVT